MKARDPTGPARKLEPTTLLQEYVKAVRTYLPTGAEADDVAAELTELLRSKIEDREEALGRPLTELEQEGLLAEYGSPLTVAGQYGKVNHGLAFGIEFIGPELFPIYLRALAIPFGIDLIVAPFLLFSQRAVLTNPLQLLVLVFLQSILMTVVFIGIHTARRWFRTGPSVAEARDAWLFPRGYLRPTPRWLSAMGLIVLSLVALWWAAIPRSPSLAIGAAASMLELTPTWARFYWPILVLLLVSVGHRAVSLARPDWLWLRPVALLTVNTLTLALLCPILRAEPFFQLGATAGRSLGAQTLMRTLNANLWWYLIGFGTYWLINVLINVRLCTLLFRHRIARGRHQP